MKKIYQYDSAGFGCAVTLTYEDGLLKAVDIAEPKPIANEAAHFFNTEEIFLKSATNNKIQIRRLERNITFEMFYDEFANKVGKDEAVKAWNKLSKADQEAAFDFIPRYKARMKLDNAPQLYPASYLNKKRWK